MMYKKLTSLFISLLFTVSIANASDISAMCAQPYDMSWKGTQILTNITGMTLLSQAVANSIVKKELKNSTGEKNFKVKMKSFSAKDLAAGRFKSLNISGKDLNFDGVYLTNFSASTICDFNYIQANKNSVKFKENFAMNYSMTVSDNDLRKTVISEDYLKFLKSLNLKFGGLSLLELENVDVKLQNDKLVYSLKMNNSMFNYNIPFNIDVSAKMKVQNGQIKATEVALANKNQKLNLTQVTNLLNMINPLNFTVNVLDNANTQVALKNLDIQGDKLILDGTLFVPKNTEESRK